MRLLSPLLLLIFSYIRCEIQNPHSIITSDDTRTLSADDIYIYQFNTKNNQGLFFIYNIEGNPQSYGYFCMDVTDLLISTKTLMKFIYLDVVDKPKVVGRQSFLSLRLDKNNKVEDKDQEI